MEKKKVSKAQIKAVAKYTKNNYDDIKVRVPKGEKEKIKTAAKKHGFDSVNSFIIAAIENYGNTSRE